MLPVTIPLCAECIRDESEHTEMELQVPAEAEELTNSDARQQNEQLDTPAGRALNDISNRDAPSGEGPLMPCVLQSNCQVCTEAGCALYPSSHVAQQHCELLPKLLRIRCAPDRLAWG